MWGKYISAKTGKRKKKKKTTAIAWAAMHTIDKKHSSSAIPEQTSTSHMSINTPN